MIMCFIGYMKWNPNEILHIYNTWKYDLDLINRAGGLYRRILTEVEKYRPNAVRSVPDRGRDSPVQTDQARLIRHLLYDLF